MIYDIQDFPWYTATPLAGATGGETWTGGWKMGRYIPDSSLSETPVTMPWAHYLTGLVYSDVSGVLYVDHSNNGSTAHLTESFDVSAGAGVGFRRSIYGSHIRLRYIDGTSAQTAFSLAAWLTRE